LRKRAVYRRVRGWVRAGEEDRPKRMTRLYWSFWNRAAQSHIRSENRYFETLGEDADMRPDVGFFFGEKGREQDFIYRSTDHF
jgi:hypothetical protein